MVDNIVSGVGVVDKSVAILSVLADRGPSTLADLVAAGGSVVAALSVSGPVDRLGRRPGDRLAADVVAAAGVLTSMLGAG